MVINLLIPIRYGFKLHHIVTVDHIEKLAKLVLLTSTIVGYSYLVEFFCAWYGVNKYERDLFWWRATGHFWWAFWTMFTCNDHPAPAVVQVRTPEHGGARHPPVRERRHVVRALEIVTSLARPFEPMPAQLQDVMDRSRDPRRSFAWFFVLPDSCACLPFSVAEIKECRGRRRKRRSARSAG
jgi:hypothetical protein